MRYKVGEKVVLRDDLVEGEEYGGWGYYEHQAGEPREKVEISTVKERELFANYYRINGRENTYVTDDMIDHEKTAELNNKTTGAKNKLEEVLEKYIGRPDLPETRMAMRQDAEYALGDNHKVDRSNIDKMANEFAQKDLTKEQLKEMRMSASLKVPDAIEPTHYNKGEIDLYEAAYLTRPFNEYRAIMEFVAERYIKRDKENRIEDLDKAIYTLERLKEKELLHGH